MSPFIYVPVTVAVAILSALAAYYLTHRNNFKVVREKWIAELRNASCDLIEAYERLYYANSRRYQILGQVPMQVSTEVRNDLIKASEDAQAHAVAALAKLGLLFKPGDEEYHEILVEKINALHDVSDKAKDGRGQAQDEYLEAVKNILYRHWSEISKTPIEEIKDLAKGVAGWFTRLASWVWGKIVKLKEKLTRTS